MKFLFGCILIAIALYFVLSQQGAIEPTIQNIKSGKTAATWRGQ